MDAEGCWEEKWVDRVLHLARRLQEGNFAYDESRQAAMELLREKSRKEETGKSEEDDLEEQCVMLIENVIITMEWEGKDEWTDETVRDMQGMLFTLACFIRETAMKKGEEAMEAVVAEAAQRLKESIREMKVGY